MDDAEVREWIRYACDSCGRPEVADEVTIVWSNRMTQVIGVAERSLDHTGFRVKLSVKLFARATHQEQYETIIHETAHILDYYINGVTKPHGPGWAALMVQCGIEPEVYHCVNVDGLTRNYIYTCPNNCHVFKLSTRRHNAMRRVGGRPRICLTCREKLTWTGKVEEPRT